MKIQVLQFFLLSSLVLGMGAVAHGQDNDDDSEDSSSHVILKIRLDQLHNHNRALAFGSIQLSAAGYSTENWKRVDALGFCDDVIVFPDAYLVDPEPQPDPIPDPRPDLDCSWSVNVTTAYEFTECPDGRYYVARSGVGVDLINRNEGSIYEWSESYLCSEDPFKSATQLDADRPLDHQNITKTYR